MLVLLYLAIHLTLQGGTILRVLLRRHRDPASRLAWVVVILVVPIIGIIAYFLVGETNIGRNHVERIRKVRSELPDPHSSDGHTDGHVPARWRPLFSTGASVDGFNIEGGNHVELMADSNSGIDRMVADIDAATEHVHLLFYIWFPDNNGRKVAEALIRATGRGVQCRVMVDDVGSRLLLRSSLWTEMGDAGVKLATALPVGNPFMRVFSGRIDLRNHRKIAVIDHSITYCGSQNCADPEFRAESKFAPWVDILVRFEGPLARQNQYVFVADWMTFFDEDIRHLLDAKVSPRDGGVDAQVVTSGPTLRYMAMPQMFETLLYSARETLFITTPYFAPNNGLQDALCTAGHRGVDTTIIFPWRNNHFLVAAASRSYYLDLLKAGVKIREYKPGLLHTKSITIDGEISFIGSANMDRRSFDLNYENNVLIHDPGFAATMLARQEEYLKDSRVVTIEEVEAWPLRRQLLNNTMAIVSPLI